MKCPLCKNSLYKSTIEEITISSCSYCGGIWFSSGNDFAAASEKCTYRKNPSLEASTKSRLNTNSARDRANGSTLNCPHCQTPMETVNYADDSGVFINRCNSCTGIWTSNTEFKKIANYLKDDPLMNDMGSEIAREVSKIETVKKYATEINQIAKVKPWSGDIRGFLDNPVVRAFTSIPLWYRNMQSIPVISIVFIILCIVIYILQISFVAQSEIEKYFSFFGFVPATPISVGLLTSIFIHANWFHLLGNMLFLWVFGPTIEEKLGRVYFIFYYFICGLCGSFFYLIIRSGSQEPAIGASGAISGIIGTSLVLEPLGTIMTTLGPVSIWIYAIVFLLIQLAYGFFLFISQTPSRIGYAAHIGGFIGGVVIALVLKNKSNN